MLRLAVALGALSGSALAASSSSSATCDFDGLVTLTTGRNDSSARVYDADCFVTTLGVEDDTLKATVLQIEQVDSFPDVSSLYVAFRKLLLSLFVDKGENGADRRGGWLEQGAGQQQHHDYRRVGLDADKAVRCFAGSLLPFLR